jgi:DNA-binding CsgD family transcriptional regulator
MGDARSAAHDLGQLDRIGPHPADLLPSLAPRARAWTAVAAADPEAARQVLLDAVASCTASGHHGAAWACAHDLVPLDRPQVLLELEPIPDEPLCELRRRHARAVQTKDLEELSQLTDTFESLGSWRWAAESAAALSRAAARVGAKQVVRRAGDRLATLTARCSGLSVPSVSIGAALTLSVREREIALLAARGLTSRAIGERLGLSIRTVDNHLARCFDKLRVSSRADLAEALGS